MSVDCIDANIKQANFLRYYEECLFDVMTDCLSCLTKKLSPLKQKIKLIWFIMFFYTICLKKSVFRNGNNRKK